MRKGIGTIAAGAVLLIAAVAGFVVVPEQKPGWKYVPPIGVSSCQADGLGGPTSCKTVTTGVSRPVYDTMRIATWALLIVGTLTVAVGLTRYARPGAAAVAALTARHDPARRR
jgi:hypothetical protein